MKEEIRERVEMIKRGEVPDGYKRTKLGIIPSDWKIVQIKECLERVNNPVEVEMEKEYTQIGIRSHGKGIFYKEMVTGKELGNKKVFWIEPDCFILNIVFAWEQAVGRTTKNEIGMIASHRFPMYRPITNNITIDYLVQYFLTAKGKNIMEYASPGGAGRNRTLGQDRFMKSYIICPNYSEQNRIAEIMEKCNEMLLKQERLIEEKQNQKRYLIQNLFIDKKHMSVTGSKWKKIKLNELLVEVKEKKGDQDIPICSVSVQKGVVNQKEHLGREYAASNTTKYNVVNYGDIVYTKSPTGEFPYGIIKQSFLEKKVAVSPLYGVFKPINFEIGYLLHSYFQDKANINNYLHPIIQKGAKNTINITNKMFLSKEIQFPDDRKMQKKGVKILMKMDKEIELLKRQLEQFTLEKKAMMQLLLTGIVRVE